MNVVRIKTSGDLRTAIAELESRQLIQEKKLKEQFHLAYESIKPVNLIKNTLKQAGVNRGLKDTVLSAAVGLGAGYFSRVIFKIIAGSSFNKFVGAALQFGITTLISKKPQPIKSIGTRLVNLFLRKKTADR